MVGSVCASAVLQNNRQPEGGVPGDPYADGSGRANLAACLKELALKRVAIVGLVWFVASLAQAQTTGPATTAPAAPALPTPASSCSLMSGVGDQYETTPLAAFNP